MEKKLSLENLLDNRDSIISLNTNKKIFGNKKVEMKPDDMVKFGGAIKFIIDQWNNGNPTISDKEFYQSVGNKGPVSSLLLPDGTPLGQTGIKFAERSDSEHIGLSINSFLDPEQPLRFLLFTNQENIYAINYPVLENSMNSQLGKALSWMFGVSQLKVPTDPKEIEWVDILRNNIN